MIGIEEQLDGEVRTGRTAGHWLHHRRDFFRVFQRLLEAERHCGQNRARRGAGPPPGQRCDWLVGKLLGVHAAHRTHWDMESRASYWPLFGLRVRTPRVELRPPDDDDIVALAELAARGVHDPDFMPFEVTWTDVESPELERNTLQFFWRQRAEWTVDEWHLPMATVVEGEIVGTQGITGKHFGKTRVVGTGSWLGREHQGKGIGKEMRAAILHFAFAGLEADIALSGAWHDNGPSLGVSAALGYEANGEDIVLRREVADRQIRLQLTRARWEERRRDDIEIEGLEACRAMFGGV